MFTLNSFDAGDEAVLSAALGTRLFGASSGLHCRVVGKDAHSVFIQFDGYDRTVYAVAPAALTRLRPV